MLKKKNKNVKFINFQQFLSIPNPLTCHLSLTSVLFFHWITPYNIQSLMCPISSILKDSLRPLKKSCNYILYLCSPLLFLTTYSNLTANSTAQWIVPAMGIRDHNATKTIGYFHSRLTSLLTSNQTSLPSLKVFCFCLL